MCHSFIRSCVLACLLARANSIDSSKRRFGLTDRRKRSMSPGNLLHHPSGEGAQRRHTHTYPLPLSPALRHTSSNRRAHPVCAAHHHHAACIRSPRGVFHWSLFLLGGFRRWVCVHTPYRWYIGLRETTSTLAHAASVMALEAI
jgi:hypothetical protein